MTRLSDDLHNMLAAELESLEVEQDAINNRRAAIRLLLGERDDDMPAATFTADDPERHVARRRVARGGSKNRADLTDAQLREIRDRAKKESHGKLAAAYGVSRATIGNIVRRAGCYA